jgi:hypothetical protein
MKMGEGDGSMPRIGSDLECSETSYIEVKRKGKAVKVPATRIGDVTVLAEGRFMRIATVQDEELVQAEALRRPDAFIARLTTSTLKADLFTFAQKLPDVQPHHSYYYEWDNLAVIRISSYSAWWKQLSDPVQRAVKKAKKVGVIVKEVEFSDAFVDGIRGIYDETPVRQGRVFWHYQKSFETVKAENSTHAEHNAFIGAYFEEELIGFIRLVYVGSTAEIVQILSKTQHQDKRTTNALIAKAVEICEQRGIASLIYCNYVYKDPNSSLTEFKRRNGFEQILVPRYYIPLTWRGRLLMKLSLHHGIKGMLPLWLITLLLRARSWFSNRILAPMKSGTGSSVAPVLSAGPSVSPMTPDSLPSGHELGVK